MRQGRRRQALRRRVAKEIGLVASKATDISAWAPDKLHPTRHPPHNVTAGAQLVTKRTAGDPVMSHRSPVGGSFPRRSRPSRAS